MLLAALAVALGAPVLAVLAVLVGPLCLRLLVRHRLRKQRNLFGEQLGGFLDELSSSLRAGHGLVAALATSVRNAPEPSRTEWGKVVTDETLGLALDDAMRSLARRMASDDVEQVALVATLHQRTGGNLAEVLDRVADGVRERIELRRQLRTLSAQAQMSRWILTGLPVALMLVMLLVNRSYMRPLFTTVGGFVALGAAALLLTVGSLIMRKLTEIEV
jgi:tight adherence protein B